MVHDITCTAAMLIATCRSVSLPNPMPRPLSNQAYEAKGVKRMYPWQAAALECGEAYNNLVSCPCYCGWSCCCCAGRLPLLGLLVQCCWGMP